MNTRRSVARWVTLATLVLAGLGAAALVSAHALTGASPAVPTVGKQVVPPTTGHFPVNAFSSTTSNTTNFARAICPSGKRVLGGGARIINGNGFVVLRIAKPVRSSTGVEGYAAQADEIDSGYSGNWSVAVTAVCGNTLPGLELKESAERVSPPGALSVSGTAFCTNGKKVIGMGGTVTDLDDTRTRGRVSLSGVIPGTIFNGQLPDPATSVTAVGRQDRRGGTTPQFSIKAVAICATTVPGYDVVGGVETATSARALTVSATCPSGTVPHSVGFRLRDDSALTYVDQAFQNTLRDAFVHAANPFASQTVWGLTPYAICAS